MLLLFQYLILPNHYKEQMYQRFVLLMKALTYPYLIYQNRQEQVLQYIHNQNPLYLQPCLTHIFLRAFQWSCPLLNQIKRY